MGIKVRSVEVLPPWQLLLEFSDGTSGLADMSGLVSYPPFSALIDEELFGKACIEHGSVEWPETEVGIATEALYAMVHRLPLPATLSDVLANELAVSLRELRRMTGKTQADMAEITGLTQGALSHFEGSTDHKLSALRKYVAALGGDIEIAAVVGGKRFPLNGV